MFQITEFTYARLASLTPRVEKHGDDNKPAVSIRIEIEAPNTLLDSIDPQIRHALYKPVDDQEQLPGVEPATPVLRCNSFDKHTLATAHEGWTFAVDYGTDDAGAPIWRDVTAVHVEGVTDWAEMPQGRGAPVVGKAALEPGHQGGKVPAPTC